MKKAFTMLELVFVIVVIGILAAVIIPNTRTNPAQEAKIQLVSHIRYAQHLAMIDDKFDATNATWYKNIWQVDFSGNQYSITHSNVMNGTVNAVTYAKNPLNQSDMNATNLNTKFGITSIGYTGSCPTGDISFDHLGRPITGSLSAVTSVVGLPYLASDCNITLNHSGGETATITISPETGYVR